MKNKRLLFVSGITIQLMYAIQIKNTMFNSVDADIVLLSNKEEAKVDLEALRLVFNRVYFNRVNSAPLYKDAYRYCIHPEQAIDEMYCRGLEVASYTDIFFWGDSWLYYFLYKYYSLNNIDVSWHLYPEGLSAYTDKYEEKSMRIYGRNIIIQSFIKMYDRLRAGYGNKNINDILDIYLINASWMHCDVPYKVVDVPLINIADKDNIYLLNRIFGYVPNKKDDIILLVDNAIHGERERYYDVSFMDKLFLDIAHNNTPKVYIKRKHGTDIEQYSNLLRKEVVIMEENYPLELVVINQDIDKNSVVVGFPSSAVILPYIICIPSELNIVWIDDYSMLKLRKEEDRVIGEIAHKLSCLYDGFVMVSLYRELCVTIRKIIDSRGVSS